MDSAIVRGRFRYGTEWYDIVYIQRIQWAMYGPVHTYYWIRHPVTGETAFVWDAPSYVEVTR
jgi:hypothetical protein